MNFPLLKKRKYFDVWFGKQKPIMTGNFLQPFIKELQILINDGIKWKSEFQTITSKVFPILCSCDAPARAAVQDFLQFNGIYGCGFCKNEGLRI